MHFETFEHARLIPDQPLDVGAQGSVPSSGGN
jgi:hypothetical protein